MDGYITGLGEVLYDCLPDGKKLGGAPANFAYHASRFGLDGIAVSAIGNDADGMRIREELEASGLGLRLERVPFPTGTVQVTLDSNGIPQYEICRDVAYDNIPWTDGIKAIAEHSRAVCFGTLAQRSEVSRDTIRRFLDSMPAGAMKVFDINLRQKWFTKEIIQDSLQRSTVLKLNDEEITVIADMFALPDGSPEDRCRALMLSFTGLETVILTCGVNGSYVFCRDGFSSFLPTPKVEVEDTVGAGDAFTGAFVAKMLSGASVTEAHATAVAVSAYVCTRKGAMPPVPEEFTK